MTRRSFFLGFVGFFLLSGCAFYFTVGEATPKPNVDLPTSKAKLRLLIDKSIKNEFDVQGQSMRDMKVSDWRRSLHNGFANAFEDAFTGKGPMLTLVILEASPSFAPTAIRAGSASASVAAVAAQIRYKARLIDENEKVLGRSKGTVQSKNSITSTEYATDSMGSALESMYEKIAADIFGDNSGADDD